MDHGDLPRPNLIQDHNGHRGANLPVPAANTCRDFRTFKSSSENIGLPCKNMVANMK